MPGKRTVLLNSERFGHLILDLPSYDSDPRHPAPPRSVRTGFTTVTDCVAQDVTQCFSSVLPSATVQVTSVSALPRGLPTEWIT